ncbi:MAG: asparagine synthase (glutamine-hydrolyzing) [Flavobacteriales bacterium]|nr:asparagine synthase (glutamine-hydrolyzing) [Flavobacteriales bacterium]
MCGISGFIDFNKKSSELVLEKMTHELQHRGPDDFGLCFERTENANIGLGQRRLSILDLTAKGHQPMIFNEWIIVFNGEIYNFREISKELEGLGYKFNSGSDTEVIIKAFDKWGVKAVDKFIGMFAFVLYNKKTNKVFVFRDRAGVKPLFYYIKDGLFLFASELKSFHQHKGFIKEINYDSLSLFLQYNYIPTPYSIFNNTHKLRPGNYLEINLDNQDIEMKQYWSIEDCYNKPKLDIGYNEACDELEKLMISAFSYRMIADVPVGAFLSGGYDSTAVVAILQSLYSKKIKTFTIGYEEKQFDESNDARRIADYLGTDHHEKIVGPDDARSVLEQLPFVFDEPFSDNSVIPTLLVSQFARSNVKVALSGDAGDEIFGGYDKFNRSIAFTKYPSFIQSTLAGTMNLIKPEHFPILRNTYNFSTRYEKMQEIWTNHTPSHALKTISQFITTSEANKYMAVKTKNKKTYFDISSELNGSNDALNKLLAIDYKTFLLDNNLAKVDRATMSVGLEGREPFLDHRIIEFASRLPSSYKIRNGVNKHILKSIVHRYVPKELMDRPKKPFLAPLSNWFGDELKNYYYDFINEDKIKKDGIFTSEVVKLRDAFFSGKQVNNQKLWNILVFQMWKEKWM